MPETANPKKGPTQKKGSNTEIATPQAPDHEGAQTSSDDNRQLVRAEWAGPLPPPAILERFSEVVENGAERVFQQFEQEASHRRYIEKTSVVTQSRDLLVGKILAFIFVISVLGLAAYAIYQGQPWLAAFFGTGAVGSVVASFMKTTGDSGNSKSAPSN